jgi:hypothetical protein
MTSPTTNQIVFLGRVQRSSTSPLLNGTPVIFSASHIHEVIERGVKRLETFVTANPFSESWICFGWIDGGLDSIAVELPVGAFRMIEGEVEYMPVGGDDVKPMFAIPFDNNWHQILIVVKQILGDVNDSNFHHQVSN